MIIKKIKKMGKIEEKDFRPFSRGTKKMMLKKTTYKKKKKHSYLEIL